MREEGRVVPVVGRAVRVDNVLVADDSKPSFSLGFCDACVNSINGNNGD